MFGRVIDYYILRPFTHSRNRATEDSLNQNADKYFPMNISSAETKLNKIISRLDSKFPLNKDYSYLDIGCGNGDLPIALARRGVSRITGVDIIERNIGAAKNNAKNYGVDASINFVCEDIFKMSINEKYDVAISHESLEHIQNPDEFLRQLTKFINKDGYAVLGFGPLFHSPFGDHMQSFFRIRIPWRGVLFSEKALLRLRKEQFRPTDPVHSFRDIKGGLNLMRFSEFMKYLKDAGWEIEYMSINPQLKKIPIVYSLSNFFSKIPVIQDYFVSSVYTILRLKK